MPNQMVQSYIDILCKLRLQLHVSEPKEVLVIKFISDLLFPLNREVDLFEIPYLDKAFLYALAVERKVHPHASSPQLHSTPPTPNTLTNISPTLSQPHMPNIWCTFHKTSSHSSADCRGLQNKNANKTLLTEVDSSSSTDSSDLIPLDNPTEPSPSLILTIIRIRNRFLSKYP